MNFFKKIAFPLFLTLFLGANYVAIQAQTITAQPRQDKLLNGLKVLTWSDPKAEKVSLRLRVHSGSAFDPKDKMGVMALLADILFPSDQTKSFFEEELGGSLEVISNYDYIQINATGKADDFLTILETITATIANPQITPENFVKVRDARLKMVEEMQKNPAYVADAAVAKRLLGDFPYGRPQAGTPESLKLIDRADLLTARDKFFTPDNATLTITGNVKPDYAYMAARRLFGAWKKSDKLVPPTFRQPDDSNAEKLVIELSGTDKSYGRTAVNAPARNDKDFYAAMLATDLLQSKLCYKPSYQAHLLRGVLTIAEDRIIANNISELPINECSRSYRILLKDGKPILPPVTQDELNKAKAKRLSETMANLADLWLDVDTFRLVSVKDELQRINDITLADLQRVAENWFKPATARVSIVVTKPAEK